ncbi:MAG: hypothetical protein APU95_05610 [Hadesarchaea archaeon YNP_N21]|jgi:uncharacterized membrane protein|nr:MAG: hypothetical protein APU95_05610 [Hadesarchaea archaeon YNP_N21]
MRKIFYLPLALPLFILLLAIALMFPLLIGGTFLRLGLPPWLAFLILITSILGSAINIPLKSFYREEEVIKIRTSDFFGWVYPMFVHERERRKTTIAVNVGGAIIPVAVSLFLIARFGPSLGWRIPLSIAIVALLCFKLARIVPGVGIVMPAFIPPLVSAIVAIVLTRELAAPLAYTGGVLGTLIGADLLNLNKISKMSSPILSIGGAGTFDGIFLTGIISVLLV